MELHLDEPQPLLGKTGQTVVYVFPKGRACPLSNPQEVAHQLDNLASEQLTLLEAPPIDIDAMIDALVEQGQLTAAQVQVGRYDQHMTGMHIFEALAARGWLSPPQLETLWDQLIGIN